LMDIGAAVEQRKIDGRDNRIRASVDAKRQAKADAVDEAANWERMLHEKNVAAKRGQEAKEARQREVEAAKAIQAELQKQQDERAMMKVEDDYMYAYVHAILRYKQVQKCAAEAAAVALYAAADVVVQVEAAFRAGDELEARKAKADWNEKAYLEEQKKLAEERKRLEKLAKKSEEDKWVNCIAAEQRQARALAREKEYKLQLSRKKQQDTRLASWCVAVL
jgi:hypothetical protein